VRDGEEGEVIKVLSLGAGVQSSTVLRLAIHGEIERPDHVIFADTGWEPRAVYEHLEVLKVEMVNAGLPFHEVSVGDIKADALRATDRGTKKDGERYANMPYYTRQRNGELGMIRRQCTREYKADPITKKIKELCGVGRKSKNNCTPKVEQWFGISTDELRRCTLSRYWWATNYYPLIDLHMTRDDCLSWMDRHGYSRPPRSACVACPYKSDAEWRYLLDSSPDEFDEACEFDDAIRHRSGMRGDIYVHRSATPLRDVDLSTPEDHGQARLWDDECAGMCGL
jgi:hypothetical protein